MSIIRSFQARLTLTLQKIEGWVVSLIGVPVFRTYAAGMRHTSLHGWIYDVPIK